MFFLIGFVAAAAISTALKAVTKTVEIKKVYDLTQSVPVPKKVVVPGGKGTAANKPASPPAAAEGVFVNADMMFAPGDIDVMEQCPNKCADRMYQGIERAQVLRPMLEQNGLTSTCSCCGRQNQVKLQKTG
jgi:hypothetical protein